MINENSQEPINQESYINEAHIPINGSGEANLSGNLQLTGKYSGRLKLNGILTITDKTRFTGEIDVIDLVVYGEIIGSARVLNRAVFHNGSSISGTLIAQEADFHEESRIAGSQLIGRPVENTGMPVKIKKEIDKPNPDSEKKSVFDI